MNLANKISIMRIVLVPLFMVFVLSRLPFSLLIAAGVFIFAATTDILDGYIARKYKTVSTMGKFLDPLADKLLLMAGLISLVALGYLNPWIAFIFISREFAVTSLRLILAAEGVILAASNLGKIKNITQIVAVSALIIHAAFQTSWFQASVLYRWFFWLPTGPVAYTSLYVALALTLVSGVDYFYKNRRAIKFKI